MIILGLLIIIAFVIGFMGPTNGNADMLALLKVIGIAIVVLFFVLPLAISILLYLVSFIL